MHQELTTASSGNPAGSLTGRGLGFMRGLRPRTSLDLDPPAPLPSHDVNITLGHADGMPNTSASKTPRG
jgi:hypothetical protein